MQVTQQLSYDRLYPVGTTHPYTETSLFHMIDVNSPNLSPERGNLALCELQLLTIAIIDQP